MGSSSSKGSHNTDYNDLTPEQQSRIAQLEAEKDSIKKVSNDPAVLQGLEIQARCCSARNGAEAWGMVERQRT